MPDKFARLRWFFIAVGPVVCAIAACWIYVRWYREGIDFVPGLHGFGIMGDAVGVAIATLAAAAVMWFGLLLLPRRKNQRTRFAAVLATLVCFLMPVMAFVLARDAYARGRNEAYRRVDAAKLGRACLSLYNASNAASRPTSPEFIQPGDPAYKSLPHDLQALKPKAVLIGRRGVILWMDGGGPAAHEGFFIPASISESPEAFAKRHTLTVLSADPPVFRFWLYDCRVLPLD